MKHAAELSIVVPVYNEADVIDLFLVELERAIADLPVSSCEIVFVNDGSSDATQTCLLEHAARDARIKVVALSRNFGKDLALSAGLHYARGAAVVCMDVDLQDPPELIADFVARWREGYDVVYGIRQNRRSDTLLKRLTAALFYHLYNRLAAPTIPPNAGDYRLLSRRAVNAVGRLPERGRFMKGLFSWVGFRQVGVPYTRKVRVAGRTKWGYWRLWNFALDGLFSFSTIPLRMWTYIGGLIAVFAFVYGLFLIVRTLLYGADLPGYPSLMVVILFIGGINMLSLGILGEYAARIFQEVKQRPLYLVADVHGFNDGEGAER